MRRIQSWQHIFLYQKILKYSSAFESRYFSVLWLKWTQTMKLKQNQTLFRGTYWNLTLFFIGYKILKYFTDFYNWNFSISLCNQSEIKLHGTCANLTLFFVIYKVVHYLSDFWNIFLQKKMDDNSSQRKMYFI